ncbi:MAG: response regulator [Ignavibacteria bacterium]|nr:response regulator [Ignavibacteria bacterium]
MSENKIKILVVDDEIHFLDSIAKRLELRGFEVDKAPSGTTAIQLASYKNYDLAIVDLKMPDVDGKQILEYLKSNQRNIEVLILTGHGSDETANECLKLGAYAYLPKPYEFEELVRLLFEAYKLVQQNIFDPNR